MSGISVRSLTVSYGGVHALSGVDLDVDEGQLVGLIGPNGAGKTTFIDAVTGFARHGGRVEMAGTDLTRLRPHARVRHGLARTWQSIELFDGLNVAENVAVAAARRSGWAATWLETFTRPARLGDDIHQALSVVGLSHRADAQALDLSQGERKLVGVARALAGRPRVLCLDEPAAGLDSEESIRLGQQLRAVVDAGTGMLLVDHDMALILEVCDTVVVLDFGKVIASGPPDEVREDPTVIAAYLGGAAAPAQQETP